MQQNSIGKTLKENMVLSIILVSLGILLFTIVIFRRIDVIYFPLYRLDSALTMVIVILLCVFGGLLFIRLSNKATAQVTFACLSLTSIVLSLLLVNSILRFVLMIPGIFLVMIASFHWVRRYRWIYLSVSIFCLLGVIALFWMYPKPWIWSIVGIAIIISTIYVFYPNAWVKLAASIWSLSFPSLVLVWFILLGAGNFYIQDEDYLSLDISSPIDTPLKVVMTKEEAMIDQVLYIRVYQPLGLGFYQQIGRTYFEYYDVIDFTVEDLRWEHIDTNQYRLSIDNDFAVINLTF